MHIKNYSMGLFLFAPVIWLISFFPKQDVLNSFGWSALWLSVIFIGNYPFLEFDVNTDGITAYQFKRKIGMFRWEMIKTVGICPVGSKGSKMAYVAFVERFEVEQILKQIKFYGLSHQYCLNSVLHKKNGLEEIANRPFLLLGCAYDPEPMLTQILHQNYEYIEKYGGQPVSVYRFGA